MGENGEIPYGPIYLTSRTISQPKMHLPLQDIGKVLLEHQSALIEREKSWPLYFTLMWKRNNINIIFFSLEYWLLALDSKGS